MLRIIKKHWPTGCLLIILYLVYFLNYKNTYSLAILNDEFGYWGNAATLAGMDWSSLLTRTPYYSIGYSLTLVPLFKLGWSAARMYKVAVLMNMAFMCVSYFCAVYTANKLFPSLHENLRQFTALVSVASCYVLYYSQIAWCETFLIMLIWCLVALFVKHEEHCSLVTAMAIVVIVMMIYLTHQRAILLVPFVVGLLLLDCIQHKKYVLAGSIIVFTAVCLIGYRHVHNWHVDYVYGSSENSDLNNVQVSSSFVGGYISRLIDNLGDITISFLSKTGVIMVTTCFTFFLACKCTVVRLLKKEYSFFKTRVLIVVSAIMMLALSSIQMFLPIRKDLVVYSRYMDFVIPQVTLLGLCELFNAPKSNSRFYILSMVMCIPLLMIAMFRIESAEGAFNTPCSPAWGALIERFGTSAIFTAGCIMVEISIMLCIVYLCFCRRQFNRWKYAYLAILLLINITGYHFANERTNIYRDQMNNLIDETIGILEDYPDSDVYCALPDYSSNVFADYRMKEIQSIVYDRSIRVLDTAAAINTDSLIITEIPLQDKDFRKHCEGITTDKFIKVYKYHEGIINE